MLVELMPILSGPSDTRVDTASGLTLEAQQRRKTRLTAIVNQGLPPFPNTVLELTSVLSSPNVDVKKAGKLIRTDPSLSAQVLRMCNSPMFGLRSRVISIEQATILLGTERLRSLALTCSLVDYAGFGLPRDQVTSFWRHSFLAALLSERLAKAIEYSEKEQAYIAGLLHDIGQVPQWMLAVEEKTIYKTAPPANWADNTSIERDHFGMDHCAIGSSMALSWNFMPSFIDVLGYHHEPEEAQHDPNLVEIVATIEKYLLTKTPDVPALAPDGPRTQKDSLALEVQIVTPEGRETRSLRRTEQQGVVEMLDREYDRLLPLVQLGLTTTIGKISY
jgi:HD-like signal output (HDOD) protein